MMLLVDGSEISVLVLALAVLKGGVFSVVHEETVDRGLGDELALLQLFLEKYETSLLDIEAFGVVRGPGSAGALRSMLSLVNAAALAANKKVFSVSRINNIWIEATQEHAYALPIYDRPIHTTISKKDALKRAL